LSGTDDREGRARFLTIYPSWYRGSITLGVAT
jgi:hypothetical protein